MVSRKVWEVAKKLKMRDQNITGSAGRRKEGVGIDRFLSQLYALS